MALHGTSVFDNGVKMKPQKKIHIKFKFKFKFFKEMKIHKWQVQVLQRSENTQVTGLFNHTHFTP